MPIAPSLEALVTKLRALQAQEYEITEQIARLVAPPQLALIAPTAVVEFAIVGPGAKTWAVTEGKIAIWQEDFPTINVLAEIRHARAWVDANPSQRKTARGMPAFLVRWLTRATNSGRNGLERRDVPRGSADRRVSEASPWPDGGCPHTPTCGHYAKCHQRIFLDGERAKRRVSGTGGA